MEFDALVEEFEQYLLQSASVTTVAGYLADLRAFARWFEAFAKQPLTLHGVSAETLEAYRRWLNRQGLKASTINRRLAAIRSWLDWAANRGYISENPVTRRRRTH